jgi:hypothetical protein
MSNQVKVLIIHTDKTLELKYLVFEKDSNELSSYFNGRVTIIGKVSIENSENLDKGKKNTITEYIFIKRLESFSSLNNNEINKYPVYKLIDYYFGKSMPEYHDEVLGDIICIKMDNEINPVDIELYDLKFTDFIKLI